MAEDSRPGLPTLQAFGEELRALTAAHPTTVIEIPTPEAFVLMGLLQLVLRHPELSPQMRSVAVAIKERLMAGLTPTPALQAVAVAGDDPNYGGGGEPH